jgi:hypothetical protein
LVPRKVAQIAPDVVRLEEAGSKWATQIAKVELKREKSFKPVFKQKSEEERRRRVLLPSESPSVWVDLSRAESAG